MAEEAVAEVVDTGAEGQPEGGKSNGKSSDDRLTALETELSSLRTRNKELQDSERFWAERAKGGGESREEPEPEKEDIVAALLGDLGDEEDDNVDSLIDELTSGGMKALKKRGLLSKKDLAPILKGLEEKLEAKAAAIAEGRVGKARKDLETDGELIRQFPELGRIDRDTGEALDEADAPFIASVSKHYRRLVSRNPGRKTDPTALFDAAEMARLEVGSNEEARRRRINAQTSGGGSGPDSNGDGGLTERQRKIIEGMGVTEEAYKKRAAAGIQLKGMPMHGAMSQ